MKKLLHTVASILLCIVLLTECAPSAASKTAPLTLRFLNTGKSDAIVILTEDATVLIDTADSDDAELIYDTLTAAGRERIDLMILTHYDNDHVGAADALVRTLEVERVIGPNYFRDSSEMTSLGRALAEKGTTLERIGADEVITFGDLSIGLSVAKMQNYEDPNNFSLITTLKFGEISLLLLGDACSERLSEFEAVAADRYDLVKLPHHGEYTKALKKLFDRSSFTHAVICEGQKEDPALTALLENRSVQVYRSYEGEIVVGTDGKTLTVGR